MRLSWVIRAIVIAFFLGAGITGRFVRVNAEDTNYWSVESAEARENLPPLSNHSCGQTR